MPEDLIAGSAALMYAVNKSFRDVPYAYRSAVYARALKCWLDSELSFPNWFWSICEDWNMVKPHYEDYASLD